MSWTDPTTRATGDLITASIWNTDLVDNLVALHDGLQFDYAQITAAVSITATTEGAATSVITGNSITYSGAKVKVELWAPMASSPTNGDYLYLVLLRDSTVLGRAKFSAGSVANENVIPHVVAYDTPSAGAHTYAAKGFIGSGSGSSVQAGAGGSGNLLPAYLLVSAA